MYFCSQKCFCIQHFYQVIFKINILIRTNIDGKTDSALLDFCKNEQIQVEVYCTQGSPEKFGYHKNGSEIRRFCCTAVHSLWFAAGNDCFAKNSESRNNADIDFVITDGDFQTLL